MQPDPSDFPSSPLSPFAPLPPFALTTPPGRTRSRSRRSSLLATPETNVRTSIAHALSADPRPPTPDDLAWSPADAADALRACRVDTDLLDSPRHADWRPRRRQVYDAFKRSLVPYARYAAFCACGSGGWLLRKRADVSRLKFVPDHCHDRWCEPCQHDRSQRVIANVKARLAEPPKTNGPALYRKLELTVAHVREPLADQLRRLVKWFRALRATPLWKERVRGGAMFLEITRNLARHEWHPHLHCIIEGDFVPQAALESEWLRITGRSKVVHLRAVRCLDKVAAYVAKYVTKAADNTVFADPDAFDECVQALRHVRSCNTFGTWRGLRLLAKPSEPGWELVTHAESLHAARDYSPSQIAFLRVQYALWRRGTLDGDFTVPPPTAHERDLDDSG